MSDRELALKIHFEAMDKLTGPLKNMFDASGNANAKIKALNSTLKESRIEVKKLEDEMKVLKNSGVEDFGAINKKITETKNKIEATTEAIKKQKNVLERNKKLKEVGGNAMGYGASITGAGIATLLPVVNSTKEAIEFESAMGGARKILDMPSPEMQKLSKDVLDLTTRTPIAAEGVASIVEAAAANGVGSEAFAAGNFAQGRKELIDFAESAAQMSIAFDITAQESGDSMAAWRASMGLTQNQVKDLANSINAIESTATGGTTKGINQIVTRVGALGEVTGVTGKQLVAMAGLLDAQKVPADVAATSIKNMLLALTKGESATKAQQAAFEKLGLSSTDVAKSMQKDSEGTILDVMRRIKSLKDYERPAILDSLFGSESILGISGLAVAVDGLANNFTFVGDEANYAGSMTKEFYKKIAETEGALGLFKNGLSAINIELGKQLAPIIADLATKMMPVIKNIRDWMEKNPKLTQFIVLFVAAIGTLLAIIGPLVVAFGAVAFALGAMGLAATPIALVIAAIMILVGLGILLYQNWGKFSEWFKKILIGIKDQIIGLFTFNPAKLWEAGKNIISGFIGGIKSGWAELKKTMNHTSSIVENTPKKDLDVRSPSRKMMAIGKFVTQGLANGILGNIALPHNAAKRIAASVIAGSAMSIPFGVSAQGLQNNLTNGKFGNGQVTNNFTFNIQGGDASAAEIAEEVRQLFEEYLARAESRNRSNLGDA